MPPEKTATAAHTTNTVDPATAKEQRFDWPVCYEAENLVMCQIEGFLARNTFAARLSRRMRLETGTLLIDWVDYLALSADAEPALRTRASQRGNRSGVSQGKGHRPGRSRSEGRGDRGPSPPPSRGR